ncbi:riboflavin synthase [Neobacillus muris]|uniref:riboflavin synthase n=1 Tax=Neobacillus muris TaxID=2941334 RepID=UPI00203FB4C4|nr:riboflavin synthase [Neobacillus muris]
MFTGIIEEIGTVADIRRAGNSFVLLIKAKTVLEAVHIGDSIAVNGACLTVTSFSNSHFAVDVMPETVNATSLRDLKRGSKVNLERAIAAGGRFGGHFVSGHIDGTGIIKRKQAYENAVYFEIETAHDLMEYIILKGSIAVDGTSLTVFGVGENHFTVSLIPHTLSETVLGIKGAGEIVNLECDMIGKYVGHFLKNASKAKPSKPEGISAEFLKENGFF